jgi:tRNA A-37 threonylcarbamoyl transferase component Bud32
MKVPGTKVQLVLSTIGMRISEVDGEGTIDNEPMGLVRHHGVHGGKLVMVAVLHSRLGLLFAHVFQFSKPKEAEDVAAVLQDRRTAAADTKILGMLAEENGEGDGEDGDGDGEADDDDDDGADDDAPFAVHHLYYLGTTQAEKSKGEDVVARAVATLTEVVKSRRGSKSGKEPSVADATPVSVVFSSEGLRIVDRGSKDIVRNVITKAISYHCPVGKKGHLYAFIEVDDRRSQYDCIVLLCEKTIKNQILALVESMAEALEMGKAKRGNPFRVIGKKREKVTGPLADVQIPRKHLVAVKAIGAGQFGKVYLSEYWAAGVVEASTPEVAELRAVKMLRGKASTDDKVEFLREAETMLKIGQHENLVQLMGVVTKARPMLIVLEYCSYGDLSDVLRACRRKNIKLNLAEQLHFAAQLAEGLQYIASKQYVHMDLAARNCLLSSNSHVKIADFGLTRPFDDSKNYHKQRGIMKLSIRWLALDAFQYKIFSEKSDVWSFAVTSKKCARGLYGSTCRPQPLHTYTLHTHYTHTTHTHYTPYTHTLHTHAQIDVDACCSVGDFYLREAALRRH